MVLVALAQVAALIIFVAMFILIVLDKIERHYVTVGCGLLTLVVVFGLIMGDFNAIWHTLNFQSFASPAFWFSSGEGGEVASGINWETIVFIAGMMVMVEGMALSGFFRWLCMQIAKMVRYKIIPIFITFMIISAVLSMFIDSITVILFLAAVTVELAQLLKFNPIPMILAEVFCANLGGSATMCGDPPNIIIGTSLGYSFTDFLTNTGVMAAISMLVIIVYFYFCFRKQLVSKDAASAQSRNYPDPKSAIISKKRFVVSWIIFLLAVVLLITHASTGLTVSTIGIIISIITLIASGKEIMTIIKKIDYKTLLFFVGLFMVVGGLEETGVLEIIASYIGIISGGNVYLMILIILWGSAIASAFVDNIPFAATMIPIINSLSVTQGVPIDTLAWTLSMGTDIGGSATPIGASANVVGTSVAAKEGYPISWGRYCKPLVPATILVLAICTAYIFVMYL